MPPFLKRISARPRKIQKVLFLYETSKLGENHQHDAKNLLMKMIAAMRMSQKDYLIVEFSKADIEKTHELKNIQNKIFSSRPRVILPFGVVATSLVLDKKKRPTQIHGQFFRKTFFCHGEQFQTEIVPIFHPDFLCINPKMKRTTWLDIQKVMRFLNSPR